MFSKSVKYALKSVLYLSVNSDEVKKVMAKDLAKPINVPPAYISKLLQELVKVDIISSTKGPKGGFYLTRENQKNPILDIIYAIEGKDKLNNCLLSLKDCNEQKPCPLHKLAFPMRSTLIKHLQEKSIQELAMEIKTGNTFLPI